MIFLSNLPYFGPDSLAETNCMEIMEQVVSSKIL